MTDIRNDEIERLTAEVARLKHDLMALNFEEVAWLRAEVVRLKAEAVADGVLIADLQTGLARVLRQRVYALRTIRRLRDERVASITQSWVAANHDADPPICSWCLRPMNTSQCHPSGHRP